MPFHLMPEIFSSEDWSRGVTGCGIIFILGGKSEALAGPLGTGPQNAAQWEKVHFSSQNRKTFDRNKIER